MEKSIDAGFKSEKDFSNLSAKEYHDLQKKAKFRAADSDIFFELADAIKKNRLIPYLADNGNTQGDEDNVNEITVQRSGTS